MSKPLSRRSSVTGAAHELTPQETGAEVSLQQDGTTTSSTAQITAFPADPKGPSTHPELPAAKSAESQPMTASNSTSSNNAVTESGGGVPGAIYGTRSRNRAGTSRPNYAEDKELDAEFEVSPPDKGSNGRKGAVETARASTSLRNNPPADADQLAPSIPIQYREPIPGTSTFSANVNTAGGPVSKKRKAASQSTSNGQPQSQAHVESLLQTQTVSLGSSAAAHVVAGFRESNMLTFDNCGARLRGKTLVADDGTVLQKNDHVYLVCEPPGEPYYLGRIMEFLHANNDSKKPIDSLRLNWYYRPKDIGRKVNDTRQVFASMHSDISPLTSLRGKCQIKHKSEVEKLDSFRRMPDSFWYEKLYDRYIHRFYDVIPTSQVINVPVKVKKVLDERWKFIVVEPGRGKELTSAVKSCKRCNKYCASNDSVDCAVCKNTYHMSCVNPPLLKKPSRGFAWACGPCSKAQEKRLEARNTPNMPAHVVEGEEEDPIDEDDELVGAHGESLEAEKIDRAGSPEAELSVHPGTAEQIHQASLWLFRYLGIHCKVEDALDYDDRIYPRASSRLGPRHQAIVTAWAGRPVEYVKSVEHKRKYVKGGAGKKDAKALKDAMIASEAEKLARDSRPKWILDEPPGYVARGDDYDNNDPNNTARLLFKPPEVIERSAASDISGSDINDSTIVDVEQIVYDYVSRAKQMAKQLVLPELSTNLIDVALGILQHHQLDTERAFQALIVLDKMHFREPQLSPAELKKFEDGVNKYGSEWHSIKKHVKTLSAADVVRFYYTWKKTDRGKQIWGNYSGRKGKKEAKKAEVSSGKLQDDVADEYDDSAFDNDKAFNKRRGFQCKFCETRSSRQWRRAPSTPAGTMILESTGVKPNGKERGTQLVVALCRRCAELWRRYAIQWEETDEVNKKLAQTSGRAWKRKIDEEVLHELIAANEVANELDGAVSFGSHSANRVQAAYPTAAAAEPPRKKGRGALEQDPVDHGSDIGTPAVAQKKKPLVEAPLLPPPSPEPPKPKLLPCAVCRQMEPMGDQHLSCKECRLAVHRNCYGVVGEPRSSNKWICDMCSNDKNPQTSVQYKCVLCPVEYTEHDFVEPPKITHKKRSERDRERERLDRENAIKDADYFRRRQEEMNKPTNPREPLKRTANNNWVHVTCAVFTPEIRFGNARALEPSEGVSSIQAAKYNEICKICKRRGGACMYCKACNSPVHVECAHQAGYTLGFDITPVKGSRRDQVNIVTIGMETGIMVAAIWCKEHTPQKTIVHEMHHIVDDAGLLTALQLFVRNFKQADLTSTGTVRKATLVNQSTKVFNPGAVALSSNRRTSMALGVAPSNGRNSISHPRAEEPGREPAPIGADVEKTCETCGIDISPKWWPYLPNDHSQPVSVNGNGNGNGNGPRLSESLLGTGQASHMSSQHNGESHVALAAAALHENTCRPPNPASLQCHQCHFKKQRKEPSVAIQSPRVDTVSPLPTSTAVHAAELESAPSALLSNWPNPSPHIPPFPSSQAFTSWTRQSPAPQPAAVVNHMNGSSPLLHNGIIHINGQQHTRPIQGPSRSPHHNGHPNGPISRSSNGYPTSPQHVRSSSGGSIQNGTYEYSSFISSRAPPHHLTNGGPPPHAPEQHMSRVPMQSRPYFGPSAGHGSPPLSRESQPSASDSHQVNGVRSHDGRINGGASASPSVQNLIS